MKFLGLALFPMMLLAQEEAVDPVRRPSDPSLRTGEVLSRAFTTVPEDLKVITLAPFQDLRTDGIVLGSLAALVAVDVPTTKFMQVHIAPQLNYAWSGTTIGGTHIAGADGYLFLFLPAYYLGSVTAGHSDGEVASILSFKAGVYAYLYAHLLGKAMSGRDRPNPDLASGLPIGEPYSNSPWDWGDLHRPYFGSIADDTGFPSFHFTLYFAVASVFSKVYGTPWVPYTLAAVALGANFRSHNHWVSDEVAGAALGIGIGHVVVSDFFKSPGAAKDSPRVSLQPLIRADGTCGFALKAEW